MLKKFAYIMSVYAVVIGSIIAIGVYIKDINFGPTAQLIATVGLIIVLFGVLSLWICYKGKIKYKKSGLEFKTNALVLQIHGYQILLTGKKLSVFMLVFLMLFTFVAGHILVNVQPLNKFTMVGPKAVTINGTEIAMPFPMTVTIDDTGWRYSYRSNRSQAVVLKDYENLVYIGEQVGTRLMCAFIISDFDKTNICADYPTTTSCGKDWNNTINLCAQDELIMHYIKDNSAYIEYGLHGVRHEMYGDGYLIEEGREAGYAKHGGEWYDIFGNKPWNFTALQNHAYVFDQISKG